MKPSLSEGTPRSRLIEINLGLNVWRLQQAHTAFLEREIHVPGLTPKTATLLLILPTDKAWRTRDIFGSNAADLPLVRREHQDCLRLLDLVVQEHPRTQVWKFTDRGLEIRAILENSLRSRIPANQRALLEVADEKVREATALLRGYARS